jgi:hypothetical protein
MPIFPGNVVEFINYEHDDCPNTFGTECRQYWRTILSLQKNACKLDGQYSYHYALDCNELNQANCTLNKQNISDTQADVAFKLQSENFCAEITVDVGISGNINSYENQSFAVIKTSYIINRRVFFLIKINSDLNVPNTPEGYDPNSSGTVVTFSKLDLVTVEVKTPSLLLRIWDNYTAVNYSTTADKIDYGTNCTTHTDKLTPASVPLLKNSIGFSFVFTRLVAPVPKNGKLSLNIIATVQATYNNLSKKRFTLQTTGDEKNTFSLDSEAADDTTAPDTTPTVTTPTNSNTGSNTGTPATSTNTPVPTKTETGNSFALVASLMILIISLLI